MGERSTIRESKKSHAYVQQVTTLGMSVLIWVFSPLIGIDNIKGPQGIQLSLMVRVGVR
jgi:hypothetical protein